MTQTARAATREDRVVREDPDDLAILTFHGVGPRPRGQTVDEAATRLAPDAFRAALDATAGLRDVQVTFDDGNDSDVTHALPALVERGRVATFFVVAGRIGLPGFLGAAGVRELAEAGMTVGSHGMHHRPWVGLSRDDVHAELVEARDRLEQVLGAPVRRAACPFGAYDRRTLGLLRDAGYSRVFTSDGGRTGRDGWLQARTTLHDGDRDVDVRRIVGERPGVLPRLARAARLAAKRWR